MAKQQAASGFPEIKVPAALTFAALIVGFVIGTLLRGTPLEVPVLAVAGPAGTLWLRALQLTILPLVIGLVYTGISQTLAAAGGGAMARRAVRGACCAITLCAAAAVQPGRRSTRAICVCGLQSTTNTRATRERQCVDSVSSGTS